MRSAIIFSRARSPASQILVIHSFRRLVWIADRRAAGNRKDANMEMWYDADVALIISITIKFENAVENSAECLWHVEMQCISIRVYLLYASDE